MYVIVPYAKLKYSKRDISVILATLADASDDHDRNDDV